MKKRFLGVAMGWICLATTVSKAQVSYTAYDMIVPNTSVFMYGANPGYYSSAWSDIALADIAKGYNTLGANVGSLRPSLPQAFLEQYGYDIRLKEFTHYKDIGMRELTVFLDIINNTKKDNTLYGGCTSGSNLFQNMYTPIWDNGENGTPVNDNNYFALYVYKTVKMYKGLARYWEIVNEPDFTYNTSIAYANPGTAGNWWQNPPKPCDLHNLNAPVFHYIRLLRIAYEVIKTVDSSSYITLGGIGYPSFLDALLRYTDNPTDGTVTKDYPHHGGAYFDVVSFHSYPQYILYKWDNAKGGFDYSRHSDAAADSVIALKAKFDRVLAKYSFGTTYPKKYFIMTEYNIPRKTYTGKDWIGSVDAQKNAMMKTLVKTQANGIQQLYVYTLGDSRDAATSVVDGFDLMGLFYNLATSVPSQQVLTPTGVAFKTTSQLLGGYTYDAAQTLAMKLPATVRGAAFKNAKGSYRYALWAKTNTDMSESASATYSFPSALGMANVTLYNWNYSQSSTSKKNAAATGILLAGCPVIVEKYTGVLSREEETDEEATARASSFEVFPNPSSGDFSVSAWTQEGAGTLAVYDSKGALVLSKYMNGLDGSSIQLGTKLEKGLYVVQLRTMEGTKSQKLVVE